MSIFERYLTVWVALCIVVGIGLGQLFPNVFQAIGHIEVAHINLPVAVLVWLMIIPMLIKIDLKQLRGVSQLARCWSHLVRQLGGQAIFNGIARLVFHWLSVSRLSSSRTNQLLHRRAGDTGRSAVHRDGIRLEPPDAG